MNTERGLHTTVRLHTTLRELHTGLRDRTEATKGPPKSTTVEPTEVKSISTSSAKAMVLNSKLTQTNSFVSHSTEEQKSKINERK